MSATAKCYDEIEAENLNRIWFQQHDAINIQRIIFENRIISKNDDDVKPRFNATGVLSLEALKDKYYGNNPQTIRPQGRNSCRDF